jgi:hypothetical protein
LEIKHCFELVKKVKENNIKINNIMKLEKFYRDLPKNKMKSYKATLKDNEFNLISLLKLNLLKYRGGSLNFFYPDIGLDFSIVDKIGVSGLLMNLVFAIVLRVNMMML